MFAVFTSDLFRIESQDFFAVSISLSLYNCLTRGITEHLWTRALKGKL